MPVPSMCCGPMNDQLWRTTSREPKKSYDLNHALGTSVDALDRLPVSAEG
jgi:hypothetical protein